MRQIANWDVQTRERKMTLAQIIADHNRQHFFSQQFFDIVITELKTNLTIAFEKLKQCNNYHAWINRWQRLITYPEVVKFLNTNQDPTSPNINTINQILLLAQNQFQEVANKNKK